MTDEEINNILEKQLVRLSDMSKDISKEGLLNNRKLRDLYNEIMMLSSMVLTFDSNAKAVLKDHLKIFCEMIQENKLAAHEYPEVGKIIVKLSLILSENSVEVKPALEKLLKKLSKISENEKFSVIGYIEISTVMREAVSLILKLNKAPDQNYIFPDNNTGRECRSHPI